MNKSMNRQDDVLSSTSMTTEGRIFTVVRVDVALCIDDCRSVAQRKFPEVM
jgi:hypothetical protein